MVTKNQLPGIQALEFDTSNTVIVKFLKRLRPYLDPLSAPPLPRPHEKSGLWFYLSVTLTSA